MHNKTIAELSQGLANGEYSSVELTQAYLNRIKRLDPTYNSFITVTEEAALASAQRADQQRADGNSNALTGIPIAQKDLFCTAGVRTTCASKILENFIAPYDATIVTKFNDAGAVCLGKTNMDEFAMGSSNENSAYGAVKNPWDTNAVPGGSSGGSAAAVAARLTPGSTGSDTGGSIRQPAALCGVTGLKPTYGRVSRWGMIAYASSLDQAGPFARTAEDCAFMLNAMAGFDTKDSTSINQPAPNYRADLNNSLQGLRIGLPKEYFTDSLDAGVQQVIQNAIREYEKLGATVKEISLPHSELAIPAYYVIAPAEASSNLSRFDGVRFGHRCDDPEDLLDLYKRSRAEGFGLEVKRRIIAGTYALSEGYYDAYYLKAQRLRRMIKNDFVAVLNDVDVIMGPTTPTPAFNIGEKSNDPMSMYLGDIYTISANLAGIPGISIPCGFVNDRPVGLQIMGNYFEESRLLNAAHQYQLHTDWHQQMPIGIE
jgi:aspartyl-tRNA(Asn)/glutamyl-tRNA(Gln) amidotransferase subunit A